MTKEELEQEAVEKAKKRTKGFACQGNCEKSYVMGALDFAKPREKCIAELENENAKLKEKVGKYQIEMFDEIEKRDRRITKAKEIIKKLYSHIFQGMNFMELNDYNIQKAEVEQFLNSENIILEDAQVGNSPFDADEVFNKEMKAYPDEN